MNSGQAKPVVRQSSEDMSHIDAAAARMQERESILIPKETRSRILKEKGFPEPCHG